MLCKATSVNGAKVKPPIPVNGELAVVRLSEWQSTQPIPGFELVPNSALPLSSDCVLVVGVGGAVNRMKAAKLTESADIWFAVPVVPPPHGIGDVGRVLWRGVEHAARHR